MTKKDPNYVAKLEKAISQKYGDEAITNPRKFWDEEKEKKYIEQSKEFLQKSEHLAGQKEKVDFAGFLVNKKLLTKNTNRVCSVCEKYSFDVYDAVYVNKFQTCRSCYIKWIESREERWATGWRPHKEE